MMTLVVVWITVSLCDTNERVLDMFSSLNTLVQDFYLLRQLKMDMTKRTLSVNVQEKGKSLFSLDSTTLWNIGSSRILSLGNASNLPFSSKGILLYVACRENLIPLPEIFPNYGILAR
jgi:hypothetical protein